MEVQTADRLPPVSVVVAVLDAADTIGECIESLLRQCYPHERREIVVVDNGSRDATPAVLAGFGSAVRVLHAATRGPAAARNEGIRAAAGEVIALTDADATADPGWLAALVPVLADSRVAIAGGTILARRPATVTELWGESVHDHRQALTVWRPPYAITMNWAARRSVFDELGPFDESLPRGSDVEFAWRACAAGRALAFCADAVVYHRNERTLRDLFREGAVHGYHGARLLRQRPEMLARASTGAVPTVVVGNGPPERLGVPRRRCAAAFGLGKWAGQAAALRQTPRP